MIGPRIGVRVGPVAGVAAGVNADSSGGPNLIAGVTRDATSGWYFPANAAEWTLLRAAAGISTANPSSLHLCQEPSGNLADSIDGATLVQSGAGHLYQQAVAGFSRLAVTTTDGTVGQKWLTTTIAPNPSLTSVLYLVVARLPAANPAAARDLFANQAVLDARVSTGGKLTIVGGASTTGTATITGTVQLIALQHDITAGTYTGFTLLERLVGTFAAAASNTTFALGGQQIAAGDVGYLMSAIFSGGAAELTTAQMRSLFQTMTRDAVVPVVIPW